MSKSSSTPTLKNLDLNDDWSSHPAVEWAIINKKKILWIAAGLLLLLIICYRIIAMRTVTAENDFFQAQAAFTQFQKAGISSDGSIASKDLDQLDSIMQRHPEIKPKYEGPLAQTLLISGQIPQAQKFAEGIFKRTQPDYLQLYQDYSQTSLLIAEEQYTEALSQAIKLKASLDNLNENDNSLLYVYNLIRLALLYQQTGQFQEELKTWQELQTQTQRLEAVLAASQVLKIGQATLNQYIEERQRILN